MTAADTAIRELLRTEVLRPKVIERATAVVVATLQRRCKDDRVGRAQRDLARLDGELRNLAETAARGGAVPAVLDALAQRDEERRRLAGELETLTRSAARTVSPAQIRTQVTERLRGWTTLLAEIGSEARAVLDSVLRDRIRFAPNMSADEYQLTVPIGYDQLLVASVPDLGRGLQETVASPTGFEPVFWP